MKRGRGERSERWEKYLKLSLEQTRDGAVVCETKVRYRQEEEWFFFKKRSEFKRSTEVTEAGLKKGVNVKVRNSACAAQ